MNNDLCLICLSDVYVEDDFSAFSLFKSGCCNRTFHYMCIYTWCSKVNMCPNCRENDVLDDDDLLEYDYCNYNNQLNDVDVDLYPDIDNFIDGRENGYDSESSSSSSSVVISANARGRRSRHIRNYRHSRSAVARGAVARGAVARLRDRDGRNNLSYLLRFALVSINKLINYRRRDRSKFSP